MKPVTVSVTGVAASVPVPIDMYQNPSNIGIQVNPGAGCTYTVQYTFDDVFAVGYNPATGNWINVSEAALVAATTIQTANITDKATAFRLNQTAGANTSTMRLVQSGVMG